MEENVRVPEAPLITPLSTLNMPKNGVSHETSVFLAGDHKPAALSLLSIPALQELRMPKIAQAPLGISAESTRHWTENYRLATQDSGRLFLMAGDQKVEHLNDDFIGGQVATDDSDPSICSASPVQRPWAALPRRWVLLPATAWITRIRPICSSSTARPI